MHSRGALWRPAHKLEHRGQHVRQVAPHARALHGCVPRDLAGQRRVAAVDNLEASFHGGGDDVVQVAHVRQRVALRHAVHHAHVVRVFGVVHWRLEPLVASKLSAGLQHLEHLLVQLHQLGRVAGGLDAVGCVEAVRGERQLQEVALDHTALLLKTRSLVVPARTLHLSAQSAKPWLTQKAHTRAWYSLMVMPVT